MAPKLNHPILFTGSKQKWMSISGLFNKDSRNPTNELMAYLCLLLGFRAAVNRDIYFCGIISVLET